MATDDSSYALYIQWAGTGGDYSGTMTVDVRKGSVPNESLSTTTQEVQAQIDGTQADVDLGNLGHVFGSYSSGTLKVNIPQQNGSLEATTFSPVSANQFNQAVAAIQSQIDSANTAAANAQQLQNEQRSIDNAASSVEGDLQSLSSARGGLSQALAQLPQALTQEKQDLATTASDEQKVISEAQSGTPQYQVCSDADAVGSDMDGVASDGDGVSSGADGVVSAIDTANSDISSTEQDLQALRQAQDALPGYQDGAPSAGAVDQATAATNSAITSAVDATNGVIATANQYETQAYQDAVAAANAGSCGAPGQPSSQPTISAPLKN